MWRVEGLPSGAGLLVVKRGPNTGSRFLLDRPVTLAGRHPDSDIFLDDTTVSRRHADFEAKPANSTSVASTAPMSTVNRWTRWCWPTALST